MASIDRLTGTVKWFDRRRGFGFITRSEVAQDVFVHKSSINGIGPRSLADGETVEFLISVGIDGRSSAVDVTGPGGVCVEGRGYFAGACYRCNKVGHMARDCLRDVSFSGIRTCFGCGEMGHLAKECPVTLFATFLSPSDLDSLPYISRLEGAAMDLLASDGTASGLLSKGVDSDDEVQTEESDEDEHQRGEEMRNWLELPSDVLLVVFKKITVFEILRSVQFVCKTWRELSYVPTLWRCIDMKMYDLFDDVESMASMAVDRSEGLLEELHVEYFPTEKFMSYITERAPLLRRLHLISVRLYHTSLVETVKRFPLLEELEISHCDFSDEVIEEVAQACPQLKSFRLNARLYKLTYADPETISERNVDIEALAIAKHMKQVRRLQLFGNGLSNTGLSAILDSCHNLEVLDIRQCLNVGLDENLKKKCARLKVFRLPKDSTADYEYRRNIEELEANDTDFDPPSYTCYDSGYDSFDYYDETPSDMSDNFFDQLVYNSFSHRC